MDHRVSEMSLASRCVHRQEWHCLAELIQACGVEYIKKRSDTHAMPGKLAQAYAEDCDLLQEYEQIIAWFESSEQERQQITLQTILDTISTTRLYEDTQTHETASRTLIITDYRCQQHADF